MLCGYAGLITLCLAIDALQGRLSPILLTFATEALQGWFGCFIPCCRDFAREFVSHFANICIVPCYRGSHTYTWWFVCFVPCYRASVGMVVCYLCALLWFGKAWTAQSTNCMYYTMFLPYLFVGLLPFLAMV